MCTSAGTSFLSQKMWQQEEGDDSTSRDGTHEDLALFCVLLCWMFYKPLSNS